MIPFANNPWDEIIPGLYMGGHWFNGYMGRGEEVTVGREFTHVFSLYKRWNSGPAEGVPHNYLSIPDGELSENQWHQVVEFADKVSTERWVNGLGRILVRCQAGLNRSGLIVGLVLLDAGYHVEEAIELIRQKRSPYALCNERFVEYLRHGYPG